MFGLILWLIVITLIVIFACPGFLTFFLCVALPVGMGVFALTYWIEKKLTK